MRKSQAIMKRRNLYTPLEEEGRIDEIPNPKNSIKNEFDASGLPKDFEWRPLKFFLTNSIKKGLKR